MHVSIQCLDNIVFFLYHLLCSVGLHTESDLGAMVNRMESSQLKTVNLTNNDLAKDHLRHLVLPLTDYCFSILSLLCAYLPSWFNLRDYVKNHKHIEKSLRLFLENISMVTLYSLRFLRQIHRDTCSLCSQNMKMVMASNLIPIQPGVLTNTNMSILWFSCYLKLVLIFFGHMILLWMWSFCVIDVYFFFFWS